MLDVHKEFGRPEGPAGAHVRACLTSAPPSVIEALIVFCHRVVDAVDCPEELSEVMSALKLDALAARHELDAQLDAILDEPLDDEP